ncbi:MAG: biotin--[acetyl-CoA-carboxylase] ligase [Candidatus Omnitrophica bacterium]|nr:biotin--[acetyl-CoA-carboxylase] ligase [Candidatus Omnitrophota bacterium]
MKVIVLDEVDSTNSYLLRQGRLGAAHMTVAWAHTQVQGRGRFRREWISGRDRGLYFSILLRPKNLRNLPLLGFCAGIALVRVLDDIPEISLKWPNDVMVNGKKLAGMLLEAETRGDTTQFVVVGIGLNTEAASADIPQGATSLSLLGKKGYTNERLLYKIVNEFTGWYTMFESGNTKAILDEAAAYMGTLHQEVKLLLDKRWVTAHPLGLDEQGALKVRLAQGKIRTVMPQEVEHVR